MQAINEITRETLSDSLAKRTVVDITNEGIIVFGYVSKSDEIYTIAVWEDREIHYYEGSFDLLKDKLIYSPYIGAYIYSKGFPKDQLSFLRKNKGTGGFPYHFDKKYEAIENFYIFNDKQQILHKENFPISKFIKYSLGLEFETSEGYIPERVCYRDGLIPLRDGSISGLEYSTVILQGDDGLSLLKQQLNTLRQYTNFNKECSLHIHVGGFPLDPNKIFNAYCACVHMQDQITPLIPDLTFRSNEYKKTGKNYCKRLEYFDSFEQMYQSLVNKKYLGDLYQPHPNDILRNSKWNISSRYKAVNFVNMLCYTVNKTIEFRFLRPTYSFEKILIWIAIFNAYLIYAETNDCTKQIPRLFDIINEVYGCEPSVESFVLNGIQKLQTLTNLQNSANDRIGSRVDFENSLFD